MNCGAAEKNVAPAPASGRALHPALGVLVLAVGLVAMPAALAEFHVWRDAAGRKQVSSIPARGFSREGALYRAFDPGSLVYQHRRLLERLAARQAELARQAAAAERAALAEADTQTPAATRRIPREGMMNLDELIALEKRGGRYLDEPAAQGAPAADSK